MKDFVLISGTSNLPLAQKISAILKKPLGKIEITRFIDNECRVMVKEEVFGKTVFVIQSLSEIADQNLVELCLIGQALKKLKAKKIIAVIPWLGYSKQDKVFRQGEAISAELVAKFIETAGFDEVLSLELHSENLLPYFKIPVHELSTHELLSGQIIGKKNLVVVSPDAGGQNRSTRFAGKTGLPIVFLLKNRDAATGSVKVTGIKGRVSNKDAVIFDDIINTGATAVKTSQFLRTKGIKKIFFLATHAVLAGDASDKLRSSSIDKIVVTDTILISPQKRFAKMEIISTAPIISKKIKELVVLK